MTKTTITIIAIFISVCSIVNGQNKNKEGAIRSLINRNNGFTQINTAPGLSLSLETELYQAEIKEKEWFIRKLGFISWMTYLKGQIEILGMQNFANISDSNQDNSSTSGVNQRSSTISYFGASSAFTVRYLITKNEIDILCSQLIADMYKTNSICIYRDIDKGIKTSNFSKRVSKYGFLIINIQNDIKKLEEGTLESYSLTPGGVGDLTDFLSVGVDIYKEIQSARTTKVDRIVSTINNLRILHPKEYKADDKK